MKSRLERIKFGLTVMIFFGFVASLILIYPIFFDASMLEVILRIIGFSIFNIIVFILGYTFESEEESEEEEDSE